MELSISVQGLSGLTWPTWKRLVQAVESLGFAGLFCADHFTLPGAATIDSLEMIVALTYLADHTQHIHFGPLVAPFSYRDPVMLARQAAVLDELIIQWFGMEDLAGLQLLAEQVLPHVATQPRRRSTAATIVSRLTLAL